VLKGSLVNNLSTRNSIDSGCDSGCEAATCPALRQIVVTNPSGWWRKQLATAQRGATIIPLKTKAA